MKSKSLASIPTLLYPLQLSLTGHKGKQSSFMGVFSLAEKDSHVNKFVSTLQFHAIPITLDALLGQTNVVNNPAD